MKKLFILLAAVLMAAHGLAQESGRNKMSFTVEGTEDKYNTIRLINRSSHSDFNCRVVLLNEDNTVQSVYGEFFLKGLNDADSKTRFVHRGTRLGVQMMSDFDGEVTFSIEYKDYPIYDAIYIYIYDVDNAYDTSF